MHAVAASLHTLIDSTVLSDVHDGVYLAITPGCDILCLREQCNIPPFLQTSTESCLWGFLSSEKVLHNWIYCQVLLQKWILAKRISLHQVCIWSHRKCCMEICTPQMPAWLVKLYLESLNQIFFFFFFFFYFIFAVTCPVLSSPQNGAVAVTGRTPGSKATYTCKAGFVLVGSSMAKCQSNGRWSSSPPLCKRMYYTLLRLCTIY